MTNRPDPIADRRAELQRRLAALSPEQRANLATATTSAPVPTPVVVARDAGARVPMSFAQELLWRLERASPGHTYNVPRAIRLNGSLDLDALQRSLDTLVERHEALRTTFDLVDDVPTQIVNAPQSVQLTTIDVGHLPADERVTAARVHMRNLARTQFDLAVDHQLRVWVIRLADGDTVLFLLSHHVTSDGWSGNILMRELTALYAANRDNRAHALAPVALQYGDYTTWQRAHLSGTRLDTLLDFWRKQLSGATELLNFPTDRPRPAIPGFVGSLRAHELPATVLTDMRALAKSDGVTSFMVLLAVYNVLIHRYSGDTELVIGTPVAGRSHAELENVVGFFSNTLLIRNSVHGALTFRELLASVRHASLSAFDNQDIPLETLLLTRGEDGRPIATFPQFVLSTEDPDHERLSIAGVATTHIREAFGSTKFDFMLSAAERPDGLKLAAEFRTELFDDGTVDRLLEQFGVLLHSALATPDTPIDHLAMLGARDRARLLDEWNDTTIEYPATATLVSLFQDQVRQTPHAVAVQEGARTLTYEQLDQQTTALAARIRAQGAKAGVLIGVCAERSLEMVMALLAVVKSGAAYVPLDPDYPAERLAFMLSDSATPIILTQSRLAPLLPAATLVLLDNIADEPESHVVADWPMPSPDDAAYMIYTSGSTGMPKGALNAHRGIVNRLLWMQQQYGLTSSDVVLQKTPYSFDVSVWEFFWPLITGARIAVATPGGHRDPSYLAAAVEEFGVTVMHFVPSMLRAFLTGAPPSAHLTSLRHLMASGEALPADVVPDFRRLFSNARLHNLYGPTECAVDVTHWTVPIEGEVATIPIGRPIANTRMYVLDDFGAPTPIGVAGELHIGGVQVGMGYHNRPDLTAEKFIVDQFSHNANARLYRTGDLAKWTPDGTIHYLGRLDFQVKLRGFRIELGEIETVIARHVAIADAIVMVREVSRGDQRLVAYVVTRPGDVAPEANELREWVRHSLPEHMVPAMFVFLDRIPLTSSGKADRKALPAPHPVDQNRKHQSPRSTIEHEVVQIWERLLSPSRPISVLDDFFDIGGHSLLAIRMLAEIERMRGVRVPLAWLFESSTVEALAARLSESLFAEEEPPLVVLQAKGSGAPVAFVHGDWTGGGWYSRRLAPLVAPDSPFYVLPTVGNDEDEEPWTIERMAARHVSELRKHQPHGPYRVVGFCVGGVVAYEMARQLQISGERIERLILIDSSPMNARIRTVGAIVRLLPGGSATERLQRQAKILRRVRWAHGRVAYFNNLPEGARSQWILEKFTKTLPRLLGKPIATLVRDATALDAAPPSEAPTQKKAVAKLQPVVVDDANRDVLMLRTQATAASAYVPGRFAGCIDFLFAEGAPGVERRNSPVAHWRLLADTVRVRTMQTGHISLITSHLQVLADELRQALND
ncbi:MAG: amino acid adenylation domain-containing protein [Gemmatimonadaceae bacterium]